MFAITAQGMSSKMMVTAHCCMGWPKAHRQGLGEQQLLSQHHYLQVDSALATLMGSKTTLQCVLHKIQTEMTPSHVSRALPSPTVIWDH